MWSIFDTRNVRNTFSSFIDILLPPHCAGCGDEGTVLCEACRNDMPRTPLPSSFSTPPIYTVTYYRHPVVKHALWELKFKRNRRIAHVFAPSLHEILVTHCSFPDNVAIPLIPIPTSRTHRRQRGYDQAALIARALRDHVPDTYTVNAQVLRRTRRTRSQREAGSRKARQENVAGSFAVHHPEHIRGRSVVIVDDVTTTGATFAEATRVLTEAGAATVTCIAIAQ